MTTVVLDRRVALTGAYNFRDLGGLPAADGRVVRRGRLFRSDELSRITTEDVELLHPFGIVTLIDLRSVQEAEERRAALLFERGVRHRHFPFTEDADPSRYAEIAAIPMEELYARFLDERRAEVRDLFGALAEESTYPAVIHCAAGKDRTGLTVALILRTLGVPDAEIVADYALTDEAMQQVIAAMRASGREEMLAMIPPSLMRALPETMHAFLAGLDARFGSTTGFLREAGVTDGEARQLRSLLLEDAA